ncbi:MAG: type II toxin-antitoxin system HicB family antitoxin [Candidatus Goldiibacteriota bacterium]
MKEIDVVVWKEEKQYVSQCVNIDVASCGDSMEEAIANLKEAVELRLEGENIELSKVERITIGKEQINA